MMKIKVFHDYRYFDDPINTCQEEINEFIKDKNVVDIKYSFGENRDNFMVIYKVGEDK